MFKIDWLKWKAALDDAQARGDAAGVTMLCSIRAMGRGRIHRNRARLVYWDCKKVQHEERMCIAASGGTKVVDLDAADQAAFVGDLWQEYAIREEEVVVA